MILAAAIGVALQYLLHVRDAVLFALIAGLLLAQLVPANTACSLPPSRPRPDDSP